MTNLTELGVAAIRDGVAAGTFTASEVAAAFNANVAAAQGALNAFIVAPRKRRSKLLRPPTQSAPLASRWADWAGCRSG